ncbi:hypothetical protein HDF26_003275 [Pedobacter cryoconitis]|uniref:DUF4280 domain-containing protein n=1 Tax=Pedobacter cryoconitis TaxID=188932 RepID=A0A7W8ZLK4_9SPHI|nr:DUF4280 domain-containing protein [Pedobacter cryoconitis]MBB5636269.1 hypothetical protein [Pedobacter cryoconitis]MBB6272815.1 hypothetical protein [Pedobacter cryoconitis]
MAEKHLVVQGATCLCNFGTAPDKLKVLTHKREFANDKDSGKKLIASNKDIGSTLEKNTFGNCAKQLMKPCTAIITEWTGFYEKTTLTNGGKILLEDSKATCPVGGKDCILIIDHGQTAELSKQTMQRAKPAVSKALNPAVDLEELTQPQFNDAGNTEKAITNPQV